MPNLYRWTCYFEEPRQGWSESWYLVRDGLSNRTILTSLRDVARARGALLGVRASVFHHRVSRLSTGVPGVPVLRNFLGEDFAVSSPREFFACSPDQSLLVDCVNPAGDRHKKVYLGGCPTGVFSDVQEFTPDAVYTGLFNSWAAAVKQANLGWLGQTVDQDLDVTSYVFDPTTGRTTLNLNAQLGFAVGVFKKRVSVNMPPGHEALDGVYLVSPVDGENLKVITTKPRPSKSAVGITGKLKSYTLAPTILTPADGQGNEGIITPIRAVKRSRGKVSFASVGRRTPVVRW